MTQTHYPTWSLLEREHPYPTARLVLAFVVVAAVAFFLGTQAASSDRVPMSRAEGAVSGVTLPESAAIPEAVEAPAERAIAPEEITAPGTPIERIAPPATRAERIQTPSSVLEPFDLDAAATSLLALVPEVRACNETPFGGVVHVAVTFAPTGHVTSAVVEGPPVAGKPVGSCIANALRDAVVPPFSGDLVTVRKAFPLDGTM